MKIKIHICNLYYDRKKQTGLLKDILIITFKRIFTKNCIFLSLLVAEKFKFPPTFSARQLESDFSPINLLLSGVGTA